MSGSTSMRESSSEESIVSEVVSLEEGMLSDQWFSWVKGQRGR
jgi:hypothetical protein